MSAVSDLQRTAANISTLVHENYQNEVLPWVKHIDPMAGLFESIGDGGYSLVGETLNIAAEDDFSGGFMGTDGYLPNHQYTPNVELSTTAKRLYVRRAADNFLRKLADTPGAYEQFFARLNKQMLDAAKRGTAFHVHGSTNATVCTFVSRTSATVLVVDAGYGHAGTAPAQFIAEAGQYMALLDASNSYATIGAAEVSSVTYNTSGTTATITFATDIDTSSTGADGDPLVFATSSDSSAANYVPERGYAPLGLLDIIDPDDSISTLMGLAESASTRWNPVRRASSDFGHVEIMEFLAEIAAKSQSEVSTSSHVITMQEGVYIELAKDLLPYQQQSNLGRTLEGGWKAVKVGEFDCLKSAYHLHDVVYAICPEDLRVVNLSELSTFAEDGSQFDRIVDYDGVEWFMSAYLNRFPVRRNRLGALTGVTNTNHNRYSAHPVS